MKNFKEILALILIGIGAMTIIFSVGAIGNEELRRQLVVIGVVLVIMPLVLFIKTK